MLSLDPNEDQVFERAGVETDKTIGELDDTSKNPLLRHAGSDENAAFERYLLKTELNEEFWLETDDFEFVEEYLEDPPADRDFLYANVPDVAAGPRSGLVSSI